MASGAGRGFADRSAGASSRIFSFATSFHAEQRRRTGDCIYDFSTNPPKQRAGVHEPKDTKKDLSGRQALVSDMFWYFGSKAVGLPPDLQPIVSQRQGHRSGLNAPFLDAFVKWIRTLPPGIQGVPAETVPRREKAVSGPSRCSSRRSRR